MEALIVPIPTTQDNQPCKLLTWLGFIIHVVRHSMVLHNVVWCNIIGLVGYK